MYVNSDYLDYCYVVDYSDNYIILSKRGSVNASWDNPVTFPVIYQYIYPSILTIESEYTLRNNQQFIEIDVTDNFYDRSDCPQLLTCGLILIFFLLFIFNGFTKFARRGGVIFGK